MASAALGQPVIDGFLHPDFADLAGALRTQVNEYGGGGAVCIYHRGECVADLWGGVRDQAGTPWQRDTMSPSFSTTKGVASTLMHIMVDRGLLDYDDRVAAHWPEFAQAGKASITIRQVMAHQSGLYHIRQMIDHADRMLDWEHMIRAIERATPVHAPGTHTGYHGLTYGFLIGEILQRVTGKSFSQLVLEELVRPLGLDGMYVGAPKHVLPRVAQLLWPEHQFSLMRVLAGGAQNPVVAGLLGGAATAIEWMLWPWGINLDTRSMLDALAPRGIGSFDFSAERTLRAAIPAANGLFTARSLAKMYAALAGGGEIDGVRLLSQKTLTRATEVQTKAPGRMVMPFDMNWRLGYHAVFTTRGVPRNAFGHFGFGGSGAWADPRRDLAVALIVNCGMGTPFGDLRIARISATALACTDRRPRSVTQPVAKPDRRPAVVRLRTVASSGN